MHDDLLVEGSVIQRGFKDSQCGEEKVMGDEARRWMVSHHAELCCPCNKVYVFKTPHKGEKQEGVKWLDFHCDSLEKRILD